ncbi:MAG TPA: carboxypeptidase-like regulatory domain-containing protein [Terriglobia bacterium]|nr:carboxypeptidase-like regulatory domain-containing protein [Terriglobia bacterium]
MNLLLLLASLLLAQETGRPQVGSVSGRIRAIDGTPASAVRVAAMALEESGVVTGGASTLASLSLTDIEGRYRLDNVPPGRYIIVAGFLDSPSYFPGVNTPAEASSITVGPGAAMTDLDFTLARPAGVRVRGHVQNVPASAPPGLLRVQAAAQNRPGFQLDVAVAADATFEFPKMAPGSYTLRLMPANAPALRIEIDEKDVDGIALAAMPMVFGRVTVEDGSPLPVQPAVTPGASDPPARVRLQATKVTPVNTPGGAGTAIVRRDGLFILSVPSPGEYRIVPALLPLGYDAKSITYGTANALESPVTIEEKSSSMELHVVLTTTPPAMGVKVSGRVVGLDSAGAGTPGWVSIQPTTTGGNQIAFGQVAQRRVSEVPVKEDGTFEVAGVPPGRYTLMTIPMSGAVLSVEVRDRDVSGLELSSNSK